VAEAGAVPSGGIDWGGGGSGGGGEEAVEVDWGGGGGGGDGDSAIIEVDWGGGGDSVGDSGAAGAAAIEVDWGGGGGGGGGGGEGGFDFEIEVEAGGEGKDDAMSLTTLFEQPSSRNQLIDDLIELQGFFSQSAAELKAGGAVSALPLELQLDQAEVEARLGAVNGVLSILEDEHTKHLWLLGTSDQVIPTDGL